MHTNTREHIHTLKVLWSPHRRLRRTHKGTTATHLSTRSPSDLPATHTHTHTQTHAHLSTCKPLILSPRKEESLYGLFATQWEQSVRVKMCFVNVSTVRLHVFTIQCACVYVCVSLSLCQMSSVLICRPVRQPDQPEWLSFFCVCSCSAF